MSEDERLNRADEPLLSTEELREVYHSVNDAIYIIDSEANIIDVNEQATAQYGYSRAEFRNGDVEETSSGVPPYTNDNAIQRAKKALDGEPQVFEWQGKDREGNVFWEEIGMSRMTVGGENRLLAIVRNIDERKRYELELEATKQELERRNTHLDQFSSMISHDLRNPLGIAKMYLDFARDTGKPDDFDAVEEALERMDGMIETLLTLARAETAVEQTQALSLDVLARTAWKTAQTDGATLAVESAGEEIEADRKLVQHVFENLYRNAVDHNEPPLTVRVGTLDGDDGFYIEDDGKGIEPAERERIFEQGYTTAAEGTGFGLAIVERVVEAHRWEISIEAAESGGARFEIITDPDESTDGNA